MTTSSDAAVHVPDPASNSNFYDVTTSHLHLDWTVDFTTKLIHGSVDHTVTLQKDAVTTFIVDTSYLDISRILVEGYVNARTASLPYSEQNCQRGGQIQAASTRCCARIYSRYPLAREQEKGRQGLSQDLLLHDT